MSDSVTPWTEARQAPLSSTVSWSLLKFMSIESVMLSNHLILCHPLFLLISSFPASVSSKELALCIQLTSPSNEYSELISFRIDWFYLLAVQGTLKSLLPYHNLKKHQFFGAQPSLWSNSLCPHGLYALCPPLTPGVCSDLCPLSQ